MKRKQVIENKWFPSVTLYQEDIDELLQIFEGNTSSFQISDDEFDYESLEEVKAKRGPTVRRLDFKSFAPLLVLHIEKYSTRLAHDGNTMSQPGVNELTRLLRARKRWILHAVLNMYTAFAVVILWLVLKTIYPEPWKAYKAIPIMVIGVGIIIISLVNRAGGFSKLVFASRFDEKAFFTRNKDTIWVGVIVAIVTAFITWLVTYLTTK